MMKFQTGLLFSGLQGDGGKGASVNKEECPQGRKKFELFRVRGNAYCEGCGLPIREGSRIPGIRGTSCSVECLETVLVSGSHCRWCGSEMTKNYTGLESRLCSADCRSNYFAHVFGDRSAELGSGKRLILWSQPNRP